LIGPECPSVIDFHDVNSVDQQQYLRVSESFLGCGGRSVSTLETGTSSMTSHGVAHGTEVLEDLLSLSGVSTGLLLLWWHYISKCKYDNIFKVLHAINYLAINIYINLRP
jgi:hypothetical protein